MILRVLESIVLFAAVFTLAALLVWFERRLLGWFQERVGPNRVGPFGLLQPLADVIKLLAKEDWTPPFADRPVFVLAPLIMAGTGLLTFAIVPVAPGIGVVDPEVGYLVFLALGALGVYSTLMGGLASRSKYALLGGLRAAAQSISYEVFLGLSALGVVVIAGTFDLRAIVEQQSGIWYVVYQPVGFLLFLIGLVAEGHRLPFDLPEGESEIVAGYHTEYSSMKFGLFYLGEYVAMVVAGGIVTTLFLGGWHGPLFPPVLWFFLKVMALVCLFILLRAAIPRPRFDQLMSWAWKVFLPLALLNLVVTAAVVLILG